MSTNGKAAIAVAVLIIIIFAGRLFRPPGKGEIDLQVERGGSDSASSKMITDIDDSIPEDLENSIAPSGQPAGREIISPTDGQSIDSDTGLLEILVLQRDTGEPIQGIRLSLEPRFVGIESQNAFREAMLAQHWLDHFHISEPNIYITKAGEIMEVIGSSAPGERSLTDASGKASIRLPVNVPFKIKAEGEEIFRLEREEETLLKDERREVILKVFPLVFYGKVVEDGPEERPVAGARVRKGKEGKKIVFTGPDGLFRFLAGTDEPGHLEIEAPGYGPVLIRLTIDHDAPEKARLIRLKRGAALYGTVSEQGAPLPAARVICETEGDQLWYGEYGASRERREWKAETDRKGLFRLDDLPPSMRLRVLIAREGKEALLMPESFMLNPGEERRADWEIGMLTTLLGRVVDQGGGPVAGARVVAVAHEWSEDRLRGISDEQVFYLKEYHDHKLGEAIADENGDFVIPNLTPGRMLVGVLPEYEDPWEPIENEEDGEKEEESPAVSGTGRMIWIPWNTTEMEMVLTVHRGLFIHGRVTVPEGEVPSWELQVKAECPEYIGEVAAWVETEGRFEVGPLMPGRYRLQAGGYPWYVDSRPVMADAGDRDVVLHLTSGGRLKGKIMGRLGVDRRQVEITATRRESRSPSSRLAEPDGSFDFSRLEPGTYDLHARFKDQWVGIYLGATVSAGKETQVPAVPLEPAARLHVLLDESMDTGVCYIDVQGAVIQEAQVRPDRPGTTFAVPPGRLRIILRDIDPYVSAGQKEITSKEVDVKAGEWKEVVFEIE